MPRSVRTEVIRLARRDAADTWAQLSLTGNLPVYYTLVLSQESYLARCSSDFETPQPPGAPMTARLG